MQTLLQFNTPEETEELRLAQNGWKYAAATEEIWNRLLRPPHKHGYSDPNTQDLYKSLGPKGSEFVDVLRVMYQDILEEYDISY